MTAPPPTIELVRTAAEQWHWRTTNNGRILASSELYRRQIGAEKAILSTARVWGWGQLTLAWNVEGVEKVFLTEFLEPAPGLPMVTYVDDRLHPVKRPELKLAGA